MCNHWQCPFFMCGDCSLPDDEECPEEQGKQEYTIEDFWDDVYHQRITEAAYV